ncbi:MAG TPA: coenzyme F420-0:L-glutamate ligase, partial [Solirubrobacterales bacterium]|nr:coenzyme F420-0:L-glutamate ligase [Solirubrobacterales bacterium]
PDRLLGGDDRAEVRVRPITGLPEIRADDPLGALVAERAGALADGDVVVVSQKVVSKAEGRTRRLSSVIPATEARKLAMVLGKEPNLVQLILEESAAVVRAERGVLIVETHHGLVCANAGIDSSNVGEDGAVLLLPEDPDASARRLRAEIGDAVDARIGVVIADSFGRAWRIGQAEVAIGCAGLVPIDDWRGRHDAGGRELLATQIAIADEAAAAADLVRDKAAAVPAAVVGGLDRWVTEEDGPGAAAIRRPREDDLFR